MYSHNTYQKSGGNYEDTEVTGWKNSADKQKKIRRMQDVYSKTELFRGSLKSRVVSTKDPRDEVLEDDVCLQKWWKVSFEYLLSVDTHINPTVLGEVPIDNTDEQMLNFLQEKVRDIINKIDRDKTPGLDILTFYLVIGRNARSLENWSSSTCSTEKEIHKKKFSLKSQVQTRKKCHWLAIQNETETWIKHSTQSVDKMLANSSKLLTTCGWDNGESNAKDFVGLKEREQQLY